MFDLWRHSMHGTGYRYVRGPEDCGDRQRMMTVPRKHIVGRSGEVRLVRGHSANYCLPWVGPRKEYIFIVFFRKPIDRAYSYFNHMHFQKDPRIRADTNDLFSSRKFWTTDGSRHIEYQFDHPWIKNFYTRALSPFGQYSIFTAPADSAMYDRVGSLLLLGKIEVFTTVSGAKRECPVIVGITERFQESVDMVNARLGIRLGKPKRLHVTKRKCTAFNERSVRLFDKHNTLDNALYEIALQRFEEQRSWLS